MIRLVRVEIAKLARRPRTYLGYLGILLLLVPMIIAFRSGHPEEHIRRSISSDFELLGTFINGLFLARRAMDPCLWFFVPLFISLVAGDLVAGEASEGTLRVLLVRPVGRVPVLLAKFVAAALHSIALTLFLGAVSLGLGALFFGVGDLVQFEDGISIIPMHEALVRLAAGYSFGALGMITVASIALLLSVLVDNANGAIIGTMMILFVSFTLGEMPYFENVRPYLFTTHMGLWKDLFAQPIPWGEVGRSAAWLVGYSGVCLAAALVLFRRKDILS